MNNKGFTILHILLVIGAVFLGGFLGSSLNKTKTQVVQFGAPSLSTRLERSIHPETNDLYELGTSTKNFLRVFADFSSSTVGTFATGAATTTISSATSTFADGITVTKGIKLSNYTSCNLDTDSNGFIQCGTDANDLTPWTSNVSANGYLLSGLLQITATDTLKIIPTNGLIVTAASSTITNLVTVNSTSTGATTTSFYVSNALIGTGASSTITNIMHVQATTSYLGVTSAASTSQLFVSQGFGVGRSTTTYGAGTFLGQLDVQGTASSTFTGGIIGAGVSATSLVDSGNAYISGYLTVGAGTSTFTGIAPTHINATSLNTSGNAYVGGYLTVAAGTSTFTGVSATNLSVSSITNSGNDTTTGYLRVNGATSTFATGALGIGTTSPGWQFSTAGDVYIAGQIGRTAASSTAASTQTINWRDGPVQKFILNANTNFIINATSSNPLPNATTRLEICQDDVGSRVVTWSTADVLRWTTMGTTTVHATANNCTFVFFMYSDVRKQYAVASTTFLGLNSK